MWNFWKSKKSGKSGNFEEQKWKSEKSRRFKKNSKSQNVKKSRKFWKTNIKIKIFLFFVKSKFREKNRLSSRKTFSLKIDVSSCFFFVEKNMNLKISMTNYFDRSFMYILHFVVLLRYLISDLGSISRLSDILHISRFTNLFQLYNSFHFQYFLRAFVQNIRLWSTQLSIFLDFQTDFWLLNYSTFTAKHDSPTD